MRSSVLTIILLTVQAFVFILRCNMYAHVWLKKCIIVLTAAKVIYFLYSEIIIMSM